MTWMKITLTLTSINLNEKLNSRGSDFRSWLRNFCFIQFSGTSNQDSYFNKTLRNYQSGNLPVYSSKLALTSAKIEIRNAASPFATYFLNESILEF
jgi:hypothetical protein